MVGFAHIVLHVSLCSAAMRAAPETQLAIKMHAVDRTGRQDVKQEFSVERGYERTKVVEFDMPRGALRMDVTIPKYKCAVTDYVVAFSEHDRTISEDLSDGQAPQITPMLMAGSAPDSFGYAKPTYVLLDKNAAACDKPIPSFLPMKINVENDADGYYAWLYPDPSAPNVPTQLAMRLTTAAHQYHYVRLPMPFPPPWRGWPEIVEFNVNEDMVDELAGKPVDTLLCPKLWRTSSG